MKSKLFYTTLLLLFCFVIPSQAETINLSIAASMTDAFKEILASFSQKYPEATMRPNYSSSGSLAKQIVQGAPADIYVSANPRWMRYLIENEMIDPGSDTIFAFNRLVFIGKKNITIEKLQDLGNLHRIALGSPKSVPAGQYAKQAMDNVAVYSELQQTKKLVLAKDVRQALLYADRGEVDGAFVYQTDALLARHAKILYTVPTDMYDRISYPVAPTRSGSEKIMVKHFMEYMNSSNVSEILVKYGFQTVK